jgi:hypothetical protein
MQSALRVAATILPGHRLELSAPEFPEGAQVEVIVVLPDHVVNARPSMLEYLNSLPQVPLLFQTPGDANRHLEEERDAWER